MIILIAALNLLFTLDKVLAHIFDIHIFESLNEHTLFYKRMFHVQIIYSCEF